MIDFISLTINPDGAVQLDFREEGKSLTSFDPAQLPDKLTEVLGDVHTPIVISLATVTAERDAARAEATSKAEALAEREAEVTRLETKIANLTKE